MFFKESQFQANNDSEIIVKWSTYENAPLVMLFGWAGCMDRYLSKYSEIYEAKNYSILRFTVPISKVNCYSSYRQFAFQIYDKVLNLSAKEIKFPIFFHVFSMNGCSLFSSLWDFLSFASNGKVVKQAVKGIIFDSCPANVMPWQGADAVSFASMPPGKFSNLQRTSYRYLLTGIFSIHRAILWFLSNFESDIYEKHFSYFYLLKCTDLPKRQLYIYSKTDSICNASSIEFFQNVQKKNSNIFIKEKVWEDSFHVEHLRKYPEEYIAECLLFTENL